MATIQVTEPIPGILVQQGVHLYPAAATHYAQFVGKTIKAVQFQPDPADDHNPQPILIFTDDTAAEILADPEGNGPGHLTLID